MPKKTRLRIVPEASSHEIQRETGCTGLMLLSFLHSAGNLGYSAMPKADQIDSDKKWKVNGTTEPPVRAKS